MAVERIAAFLTRAQQTQDDAKQAYALCKAELDFLYGQLRDHTAHRVISRYRNALKEAGLGEPFLRWMREPEAKATARRDAYKSSVFERVGNQRPIHDPEAWIACGDRLLEAEAYVALGLGLMMLTGRRSYEIFKTAQFTLVQDTLTHVHFTGQAKTRGAASAVDTRLIPVLVSAPRIIDALARLRGLRDFRALTADQVHSKMSKTLQQACHRYLKHVVAGGCKPKDTRAIYALLAYTMYCPRSMDKDRFIAEILCHRRDDLTTVHSYKDFFLVSEIE